MQTSTETPIFDERSLTPEERRMVDDFAAKIQLSNSNMILQYGAGAQKKMADFSEDALSNIRTKDLGAVGDAFQCCYRIKSFDVEEEERRDSLAFFKRSANKMTALKAKYDKVEANVEKICAVLERHQVQLLKDVAMMDKMYEMNKVYFKELSMYILAAKRNLRRFSRKNCLSWWRKQNKPACRKTLRQPMILLLFVTALIRSCTTWNSPNDIHQMAPEIQLVQSNDTQMSEKIQSTLVNTIPLWKSQMALALGIAHSQQAAQAQREVTDMTNELLRRNAATLKMATVETAKETERGVVDMATLQETSKV